MSPPDARSGIAVPTRWRSLLPPLLACATAGCPMYKVATAPAPEALVETPGVVIWDRESAFRLEGARPVPTPFVADACLHNETTENFAAARALGARPVVVQVPGLPQPIYGLLSFCRVPVDAQLLDRRQYRLVVPEDKVLATSGGRVSVVARPTSFYDLPAWQLWLSRSPALWQ